DGGERVVRKKTGRRSVLLGAAFLLALPLALLYVGYTVPQQLRQLDRYLTGLEKYQEVSGAINHLTASVHEYIFYGDLQALNDYRHYGQKAVDSGIALYDLVDQSQKQAVEELINLTKNYIDFMETEVIPARRVNSAGGKMELLRWQQLDLTRQLVYRTESITKAGRAETQEKLHRAMVAVGKKGAFALFFSLVSLGVIFWAVLLAWPWLIQTFLLTNLVFSFRDAVLMVDREGRLRYLNPAAEDLLGLPGKEVTGQNVNAVSKLFPHFQGIVRPLKDVVWQKKKLLGYETGYFREERKLALSVDYLPGYFLRGLAGIVLLVRESRPQDDRNILLETIENERKRISIEIHDWIGRYLSSIIHGLDYLLRMKEGQFGPEAAENLLVLRAQCQQAAIDMRSIMNDIHPYLIEKAGLIPALESYVVNFERVHNKKVYIYYQNRPLPLTPAEQITVYRIIQEALTNVAKHSSAAEVDIYFQESGDRLGIEIIDNGGVGQTPPVPGKGLWAMQERARSIGGNLLYGYREGGFYVALTLPRGEDLKNGCHPDHAGGGS
ncbi:MAG: PAS domain-containing protein, partial [Bacillota bacterium]